MDPSLLQFSRLGVFADWRLPTDEQLAFVSQELGFNEIILGLWPVEGGHGWKARYTLAEVDERVRACRDATLMPVIMVWLVRSPEFIESTCNWLLTLEDGNLPIVLDAEEAYYRSSKLTCVAAAQEIRARLADRYWGVTSITKPPDTVDQLIRYAKFVVPQCYSFWKPGRGNHWSHSRSTFPGPAQALGATVYRAMNPQAEMIMGLGCYWAERPAHSLTPMLTASQVMRIACTETMAQGITTAWWWSLKWLMEDGERGDEVRNFFGVVSAG